MSAWRDLVTENPVMIDVRRFQRRFLGASSRRVANAGLIIMTQAAYLLLVLLTVAFGSGLSAAVILYLQTFLLCFIVPGVLHGAIAGERERRTWDMLIVAPISRSQIVIGKFATGLTVIGVTAALFLLPTFLAREDHESIGLVMKGELVSIGYAIALAGLTLLVSAKFRRAFPAQLTVYTIQFAALVIGPTVVGILSSGNSLTMQLALFLHPFVAQAEVSGGIGFNDAIEKSLYGGWQQLVGYLLITAACLYFAVMVCAEEDRKGEA